MPLMFVLAYRDWNLREMPWGRLKTVHASQHKQLICDISSHNFMTSKSKQAWNRLGTCQLRRHLWSSADSNIFSQEGHRDQRRSSKFADTRHRQYTSEPSCNYPWKVIAVLDSHAHMFTWTEDIYLLFQSIHNNCVNRNLERRRPKYAHWDVCVCICVCGADRLFPEMVALYSIHVGIPALLIDEMGASH